jgi:hypothetical protein
MIQKLAAVIAVLSAQFQTLRSRTGKQDPIPRRLSELEKSQAQMNSLIQEFMTETEKVMEELSRLVREVQENVAAPETAPKADLMKSRKSTGRIDAKHHVVQLSRQGKTVEEISSQLQIPGGEVQLILNLQRDVMKAAAAR